MLGPTQSRTSPSRLWYAKIKSEILHRGPQEDPAKKAVRESDFLTPSKKMRPSVRFVCIYFRTVAFYQIIHTMCVFHLNPKSYTS